MGSWPRLHFGALAASHCDSIPAPLSRARQMCTHLRKFFNPSLGYAAGATLGAMYSQREWIPCILLGWGIGGPVSRTAPGSHDGVHISSPSRLDARPPTPWRLALKLPAPACAHSLSRPNGHDVESLPRSIGACGKCDRLALTLCHSHFTDGDAWPATAGAKPSSRHASRRACWTGIEPILDGIASMLVAVPLPALTPPHRLAVRLRPLPVTGSKEQCSKTYPSPPVHRPPTRGVVPCDLRIPGVRLHRVSRAAPGPRRA